MGLDSENAFIGLDTYNQPDRLGPGYLQQADNVLVQGRALVSRPGIQGQFAATMSGGAIWEPTEYRKTDNTSVIVFAQNGKLWKWSPGDTAATEITKTGGVSFAFASGGAGVRLVRFGKFLYGCDALNGSAPLFRINLEDSVAEAYTGMTAPTSVPSVALTNSVLDDCSSITNWDGYPAPSSTANLILNGSFESGTYTSSSGTNYPLTDWNNLSATPLDARDITHTHGAFVPYDDPDVVGGGAFSLLVDRPGDTTQQTISTLPTISLPGIGVPRLYLFTMAMHQSDPTGKSSALVTITAQNTGAVQPYSLPYEFKRSHDSAADQWGPVSFGANFWDRKADPDEILVTLQAGPQNAPGDASLYVDAVHLTTPHIHLGVQRAGDNSLTAIVRSDAPEAAPYVAGQWVVKTYTSAPNFAKSNTISTRISLPEAVLDNQGNAPTFRFGFQAPTDTTISWSNDCSYTADGKYLFCDCSTVDTATRAAATKFYIQILEDIPGLTNNAPVFTFGPITASGNLAIDRSYTWIASEIHTTDHDGQIESSGSPLSEALTPTGVLAEAAIGPLPAYINTNPATDTINLYRGGGVFTDGFWRLVATLSTTSGTVTGPGAEYITWDHSARTIVDNTPDSALLFADLYEIDRDNFPAGITSLCVAHGRLFASVGNTIYISWLLASDSQAGLYTSNSNDPADPSLAIKGAAFALGAGNEGDSIVALVPLATAVVALRRDAISQVAGTDPTNFSAADSYRSVGIGCVAARSAIVDPYSGPQVAFLSQSGLIGFNLDTPTAISREIERLLNPSTAGGDILDAAAYALAAQVSHDQRRYLFAPGVPGDSTNTVVYVWDVRVGAWVRWTNIAATSGASGVTGGCSTGTDLYLGGFDGMLYKLTGTADRAAAGGGDVAIPVAILTRKFGQDDLGAAYWYENTAQRAFFEFSTPEAMTATLSVYGGNQPQAPYSGTWQADPSGDTVGSIRIPPAAVRGVNLWLGFAASVTERLVLRALALQSAEGRRR